ncbi:lasso RiPP family leader peptide-containing protein [Spirosoma sp. KCTC 42546]|uniref:lasso RiPP family leader peptide-containing protein n=1 Tax=Spirosoma sp. KCTC 42546 TaxID=2520506 RepID=UPI00115B5DB3|nr:lasso RiPP family leader peptide-containing protein [Spirosoma sp. KCTC 42546]QDK77659.1 lasso RiPP family leader peptide-containing protein [Spirosoma sp. KCTC 42546]
MKINQYTTVLKSTKRTYKKPTLIKLGNVSKLTLKGGSAFDAMSSTNDFQA